MGHGVLTSTDYQEHLHSGQVTQRTWILVSVPTLWDTAQAKVTP